jgi:hypothetical protein
MGSCPAFGPNYASPQASLCDLRRQSIWKNLRAYHPDVVVLGGAWGNYARAGTPVAAALIDDLSKAVAQIKSMGVKQVLVMGPGPRWNASVSSELFREMALHHSESIPQRLRGVSSDLAELDLAMREAAVSAGAAYFSPLEALCNAEGCRVLGNPESAMPDVLFFDKDHLSRSGSAFVVELAMPLLDTLIRPEGYSPGRLGALKTRTDDRAPSWDAPNVISNFAENTVPYSRLQVGTPHSICKTASAESCAGKFAGNTEGRS